MVVGKSRCYPDEAEDVPDYSGSTARMNMYAYICPTPGEYTDTSGTHQIEDQRTVENFQKYKDCGFDTLMLMGNDKYIGEDFETSDLKKTLDMAQEVGLKVIVFDNRLYTLSEKKESIIGDGKDFSSEEALVEQVREWMAPYIEHPAFYGVSLVDEPYYNQFIALSQVIKAVRTVDSNIYTHKVLHPYAKWMTQGDYSGNGSTAEGTAEDYASYISNYLAMSGDNYVSYDNYPFMQEEQGGLWSRYYENMQIAVKNAALYNAPVTLTIQSFGQEPGKSFREVEEDDIRFQGYSALGLGVKNLLYYTYYMFPDNGTAGCTQAIVDHDGRNILYNEVRRVNRELHKLAKVMLHFDYVKANFSYPSSMAQPKMFENVENDILDGATVVSQTQATFVSQMYDEENKRTGYMVMNASDTAENKSNTVSVKFDNYLYATIYVKGVPQTVSLRNQVLELTLESGEGVFVIPHN